MIYTLPTDTGACIEPAGILSGDQRKVPHACLTKAKTRALGFHVIVAAGDSNIGKTKLLLGFLPAGRNRVLFELSMIDGVGATVSGALMAAEYTAMDRLRTRVPKHAISGTIVLGDPMSSLTKNQGATVAADSEFSRPNWGFKYESLDDIPVWITCSPLAAGNEIYGNIIYGQE